MADHDAVPLSTCARWSEIEKIGRLQVGIGRLTFTRTKGKKNRTVPVAGWLQALLPAILRGASVILVTALGVMSTKGWGACPPALFPFTAAALGR